MSRKDFEAIARIIRNQQVAWLESNSGTNPMLHRVASYLATYLATTNPLFDRSGFLKTCNPEWI